MGKSRLTPRCYSFSKCVHLQTQLISQADHIMISAINKLHDLISFSPAATIIVRRVTVRSIEIKN